MRLLKRCAKERVVSPPVQLSALFRIAEPLLTSRERVDNPDEPHLLAISL